MTAHPSREMPPHGRAAWDGTAGLGAGGQSHSVLTGDRLGCSVEVGQIVWTKADDGARGGMVIDVEVDEMGERQVTVITHNESPTRPQAWTFRLPESDFDAAKTIPDNSVRRHAYAKACYLACGQGRFVTESDLRIAGIAAGLVGDRVKGR